MFYQSAKSVHVTFTFGFSIEALGVRLRSFSLIVFVDTRGLDQGYVRRRKEGQLRFEELTAPHNAVGECEYSGYMWMIPCLIPYSGDDTCQQSAPFSRM